MHDKFDLAGRPRQGFEMPRTFQLAKRPAFQTYEHFLGLAFAVLRGEMLLHLHVVDMDCRFRGHFVPLMQLGTATPGQKLRIAFDSIDQHEHFIRRIGNKDGFYDFSHEGHIGV